MKVLALDYGAARTGVAVSDPTGTLARPLGVVERAASDDGLTRVAELVASEEVERVVVVEAKALKGGALRDLSDRIRRQEGAVAALVGSTDDGRAFLVVNLDQSLAGRGLDASAIVREAAARIGGGGGGRPTLAEAGGKHPEKLHEALEVGKQAIVAALA